MFKKIVLATFISIYAIAASASDLTCAQVFSGKQISAEQLYSELKATDKESLKLRNKEERDLLIQHFQAMAGDRPILIFTDASFRQTSGVVIMMKVLKEIEDRFGIKIKLVVPEDFKRSFSVNYQDLVFALPSEKEITTIIERENPFAVHIMVEGSVGRKVRKVLLKKELPFTTAYHTDFPTYLSSSVNIPLVRDGLRVLAYKFLRNFHKPSEGVMVPTKTMRENLEANGFDSQVELRNWSHGVDIVKFDPQFRDQTVFANLKKPVSLYVGRVAPEKNIEAFLSMNTPGTKVVIGDGPSRAALQEKYPDVVFMGRMPHEELPKYFASADLFVFTSLTDTFGLVLLEAAASGTPVLAFNYQGPKDAVASPRMSVLVPHVKDFGQSVHNLEAGFAQALSLDRVAVRAEAEKHSWETSLLEFIYFLKPLKSNLDEPGK